MNDNHSRYLQLKPHDNNRLAVLCGLQDEHLRRIEKHLNVAIHQRGNVFQISGDEIQVNNAHELLFRLYEKTKKQAHLSAEEVHIHLKDFTSNNKNNHAVDGVIDNEKTVEINTASGAVRGHTKNQQRYLENIRKFDINFSIGPAGTGKTYLAVASAVNALEKGIVSRILLVRPAVEAGERLGFLPGSLEDKISPYLRPLYDALFEMLGFDRVNKLLSQNIIEVAPLAYMRGRTLNDAFIILDESQNTTTEQMKMFLTRIGFNSKAIITGDVTQVDLPKGRKSGLVEAAQVLKKIPGICFTFFDSHDVVRHPLVQRIIEAYEGFDQAVDSSFSSDISEG